MATGRRQTNLGARLGAGELELLEVLWRCKAVTIAEAQAALDREQGYTTVQTRLERLVAKGVAKKSSGRPAKYSAAVSEQDISRDDLNVLVHRVTRGRVVPLIAHLVNERTLSADEIQQIRDLIETAEARSERESGG
ncbi:MAG: BlaI/MecI/CopY family transcriptional regulator [Planctomycetaceae bacterium]|nr:BlaI/MecI/CopY family transcriptional regulator [Planctomycetaceae bacterium]